MHLRALVQSWRGGTVSEDMRMPSAAAGALDRRECRGLFLRLPRRLFLCLRGGVHANII